jgi:hypothetical protein
LKKQKRTRNTRTSSFVKMLTWEINSSISRVSSKISKAKLKPRDMLSILKIVKTTNSGIL